MRWAVIPLPDDALRSPNGWMGCIGHGHITWHEPWGWDIVATWGMGGMGHGRDGTALRDSAVQGRQGGSTPWQPAWLAGQVLLGQCHRGCRVHRSEMRSCPDRAAQVTRSATALARLGDRAVFTTLGFRNVRGRCLSSVQD
jgi:hypothetical protein